MSKTFLAILLVLHLILNMDQQVLAQSYIQNPSIPLPSNAVLYTYQDHDGYIWFGTYDGLSLYNGKDVVTFRHEPGNPLSLCSNIIFKIANGGKDHIWISTSLGLNRISLKERKVTESFPELGHIVHINTDENDDTWIISKDNVLSYTNPKLLNEKKDNFIDVTVTNPGVNLWNINSFFFHEQRLNIVTNDGHIISENTSKLKQRQLITASDTKFHDIRINKLRIAGNQIYFIDIENKIYVYNLHSQKKKFILDLTPHFTKDFGFITHIEYFNNNLFVAFKNEGILKIDTSDKGNQPIAINNGMPVFCILKDRFQDLLWIGTDGQGVQQYVESPRLFNQINLKTAGITNKPVRAILTDSLSNIWIGTNGDGLYQLKHQSNTFPDEVNKSDVLAHFSSGQGLTSNQVFGLEKSKYHPLFWIGTEHSLYYYTYHDRKIREVINTTKNTIARIHTIREVNDSTLWMSSTGFGLIKATIEKQGGHIYIRKAENYSLRSTGNDFVSNDIHSISYDNKQHLMVGTRGGYGVVHFDILDDSYHFIPLANKTTRAAIGDVLSVYQSLDSIFYIGSSSGMTKLSIKQDRYDIEHYGKKEGMINDMVHGILPDNHGYIWMSSNMGLIKFNPENNQFHNYISPTLNIYEFSDDAFWKCPFTQKLYFGGVNGIVAVNPSVSNGTPNRKNFHFFDIRVGDESFPLSHFTNKKTQMLEIPDSIPDFSLSFIALDYIDHNNYEYAWMLEGYHNGWVDLQRENKIDFVNIPYGKYTLKIRYKNDVVDGSENIEKLDIQFLPPYYLSRWAYLCYALIMSIIIIYVITTIRRRIVKKHRQILEEIEKNQRRDLLEIKLNFFTNVTHEFYTPLTLIKGICEMLEEKSHISPRELKKHIQTLSHNAEDLEALIKEILEFRNLEKTDSQIFLQKDIPVSELVERNLQSFRLIANKARITLEENIQQNTHWNTDLSGFQRIINNLVSNAFKYTPSDGTVNIMLKTSGDELIMKVRNSGKGIKPIYIENIFDRYTTIKNPDNNAFSRITSQTGLGLSICYEIVESLQGKIQVVSEPDTYTEFCVTLPRLLSSIQSKEENHTEALSVSTKHFSSLPTILVVEDNHEIASMVKDFITDSYTVLNAYSAEEALEILNQTSISLLITDIMLPEQDGIQLISLLKQTKHLSQLPIIVISAKVTTQQQEEGIQTGADVYLTKPFSLSLLKSHIDGLLVKADFMKTYYQSAESAYELNLGSLTHQDDKEFMRSTLEIIDQHIESNELSPSFIADRLNIHPQTLYRKIKSITSSSIKDYIKDYRFVKAEKLLRFTDMTVQEIMFKVGLSNKSYFYREFVKRNNVTPKEYRKS